MSDNEHYDALPGQRRRDPNPEARAALARIFNQENGSFKQCADTLERIEKKLENGVKSFSAVEAAPAPKIYDPYSAQRVLKAEAEKRNRAQSNPLPGCRDLATIFNEEAEIERWAAQGVSVEFQADNGIRTLRLIGGPKFPQ
jgi:hypothetical protein